MKILLLVIGKTDEKYLLEGMSKYRDRLKHYIGFNYEEIPDIKNRKSLSEAQQKKQEADLILTKLKVGDKLVLLDEPTSGVNPTIIQKMGEILKKMVKEKGMSVFLIEHNMKFVTDFADFCNFISHGHVVAFGTPKEVLNNNDIQKSYLGV